MPPSHWVSWRQISSEFGSASTSVSTVAPVVVKPDMASKYALIGLEMVFPESTYRGSAPKPAARSQVSETTRKLADPDVLLPVVKRSTVRPRPPPTPAMTNGQTGSSSRQRTQSGRASTGWEVLDQRRQRG